MFIIYNSIVFKMLFVIYPSAIVQQGIINNIITIYYSSISLKNYQQNTRFYVHC